jgi:serine/threonine protein kinase
MKKHTVQANGDVLATAVEKRMLELAWEHPYLAHLVATIQDDSYLYFVMEFLSGGDLMHHIQQRRYFDRKTSMFYAAEIYCGLNFLHKRKIVYRDLKVRIHKLKFKDKYISY